MPRFVYTVIVQVPVLLLQSDKKKGRLLCVIRLTHNNEHTMVFAQIPVQYMTCKNLLFLRSPNRHNRLSRLFYALEIVLG